MTDPHVSSDIRKQAFRLALMFGILNGLWISLIVLAVSHWGTAAPVLNTAQVFALSISFGIISDLMILYQDNMSKHDKLLAKAGGVYLEDYRKAIAELGLARMIFSQWFRKRYKEIWDY